MPDDGLVSGAELGDLIGLHERQVRKLAERGVIIAALRGRYDAVRCILSYIAHLREQAAGRAASDEENGAPDLARERALLARAQREGQAMKNAVLRGDLLPVDDVEAVVGAVLDATRTKMLALPTKAAPQCVGMTGLNEARALLTGLVHDALNDLSDTPVVVARAADRARRRIGGGIAGDATDEAAEGSAKPDGQPVGRPEPEA